MTKLFFRADQHSAQFWRGSLYSLNRFLPNSPSYLIFKCLAFNFSFFLSFTCSSALQSAFKCFCFTANRVIAIDSQRKRTRN